MDASPETLTAVFGEDMFKNHLMDIIKYMTEHPDEYHQKVWNYYATNKNENLDICRNCGGKCCINMPCHFAPDDFKDLSYKALKRLLIKKKYISIVKFSKRFVDMRFDRPLGATMKHFFILRIRTSGTSIAVRAADVYEDDLCMLLGKDGCMLSYEERPKGARMLIPKLEERCEQLYNMEDCTHDWVPHQKTLERLYEYFERRQKLEKVFRRVHL